MLTVCLLYGCVVRASTFYAVNLHGKRIVFLSPVYNSQVGN